ncbi:MAG TPA: sigma-70 family RNA polymerase sigma factor [Myxococcaceae bacterium]|nr:sigma-70 family RNA polymerase sigma factor [Myxococcaceae bacterium]
MRLPAFPHAGTFWARLPRAPALRTRPGIEDQLAERLAQALSARSGLTVDHEAFVEHWARQLARAPEPEAEFDRIHLADLLLAFACGHGDPEALRMFRAELLPGAVAAVRGVDPSGAFVEEVTQQLLERILVSADGHPRILEYAGRGSLEHWLRAAALRLALNARRDNRRAPEQLAADSRWDAVAPTGDLQLGMLQQRYGQEFGAALKEAMVELSSQERSLLRLHFLDGLSLNQIGAVYQVNKSTISRRMSRARETLLARTRDRLERRLQLGPTELESLMRVLAPGLELSLTSVLMSESTPST